MSVRRVLVVDDDAGVRMAVAAVLEDEGYEVTVATDGLDGLDKLGAGLPALVVLDVMMPFMDGYGFARELRQRGLSGRLPVLVLTADAGAQARASELGAGGFLSKPFDIDDLLNEVERLARA